MSATIALWYKFYKFSSSYCTTWFLGTKIVTVYYVKEKRDARISKR